MTFSILGGQFLAGTKGGGDLEEYFFLSFVGFSVVERDGGFLPIMWLMLVVTKTTELAHCL